MAQDHATQVRPGVVLTTDGRYLTVSTLKEALSVVESVVAATQDRINWLRLTNQTGGIEWTQRQQLRAIEGHLSKAIDACIEFVYGLGTDDAEDLGQVLWPEDSG